MRRQELVDHWKQEREEESEIFESILVGIIFLIIIKSCHITLKATLFSYRYR